MRKKIFFKTLSAVIILSLLLLLGFSGCRDGAAEAGEAVQENSSAEAEQAVEDQKEEVETTAEEIEEAEEEVESTEDTVEQEENSPGEPAQIIDITPEEVFEILENQEDYLILDVRTKEEYDEGHLESAVLLPVQELGDRLGELPTDKPIVVYCRSGSRSRNAAEILINNGFTMVYDMGGISGWISKGYPVIVEE